MTHSTHRPLTAAAGLGLAAWFASPVLAANLDVPDDFPTIQAAIDAAVKGDVIRIDEGEYAETIFVNGKSLSLVGQGGSAFDVTVGDVGGTVLTLLNGADVDVSSMRFKGGTSGGVRLVDSEGTFDDVFIVLNESSVAAGLSLSGSTATVTRSIIADNTAQNAGGGIYLGSESSLTITDSWINGNTQSRGAIFLIDSSIVIDRCLLRDNGSGEASAIELSSDASATVLNSLMYDNAGQFPFEIAATSTLKLFNATVADNESSVAGLADNAGTLLATNVIARDATVPAIVGGGFADVRWSNVSGGLPGAGNIDADPMFAADGSYGLEPGSPCIDAADGSATPSDLDFNEQPRFVDDLNITDTGAGTPSFLDMGAIERQPTIRYVRSGPPGTGLSWADPHGDLQDALDEAALGGIDEIWVAAGVYFPDRGTDDRAMSFEMQNGLAIYGGYEGVETRRDERDPDANPTALSGAIGESGFVDNAYHVVRAENVGSTGILEGFEVRFGNASGVGPDADGGGISISGGAPQFRDLLLRNNQADELGAAIHAVDSDATFDRIRVRRNGTTSDPTSAIYLDGGAPTITNAVVHGNEMSAGAGISFAGTDGAALINSTVYGNTTGSWSGGVFATVGSELDVFNTIIWGNVALNPLPGQPLVRDNAFIPDADLRSSTIEGQTDTANGNNGLNPKFEDPIGPDGLVGTFDDDFRLQPGSCMIDFGDDALVPDGLVLDVAFVDRVVDDAGMGFSGGPFVDRGAYEFQGTSCFGDVTVDGEIGFSDLLTVLAAWGTCDGCPADVDCDGVVGFNDLLIVLAAWGPCD